MPASDSIIWAIVVGEDFTGGVREGLCDAGARVIHRAADIASREEAEGLVARMMEGGAPDLVLLNVIPAQAMAPLSVEACSAEHWRAATTEGLRTYLHLLQALDPVVTRSAAAVLTVAPSLSLVGCAELPALTALLEAQRGLMKSAARQWGASGASLNWIAAAPRALSSGFDAIALAAKPDAVSVARGAPSDPRRDIAPVALFLASRAGRAFTGATLTLDGGEWMVP